MHDEKWLGIISRITPHEPVDLDQTVFDRFESPVTNLSEVPDDLLTIHSSDRGHVAMQIFLSSGCGLTRVCPIVRRRLSGWRRQRWNAVLRRSF